MKKLVVIISFIIAIGLLSGCSAKNTKDTNPPPKIVTPGENEADKNDEEQTEDVTKVGDFYLGQPEAEVDKLLGQASSIRKIEEGFYYKEPYNIKEYKLDNGEYIQVITGENSKKVLDFTVAVSGYKTNLGVSKGDTYASIEEKYKDYKKVENPHQGGELSGWYYLNNDQIIIFDFDMEDQSSVNLAINSDSKLEAIRVARREYFD